MGRLDSDWASASARQSDRAGCPHHAGRYWFFGFDGNPLVMSMKTLAMTLLFALLLASSARAQDSTRLQRFEYVIGASLAFSLLDYVGYNLDVRQLHNTAWVYHGLQFMAQAAITYFLYKTCGWTSAISFNLIWWTWCDDLAYYGWAYAIN